MVNIAGQAIQFFDKDLCQRKPENVLKATTVYPWNHRWYRNMFHGFKCASGISKGKQWEKHLASIHMAACKGTELRKAWNLQWLLVTATVKTLARREMRCPRNATGLIDTVMTTLDEKWELNRTELRWLPTVFAKCNIVDLGWNFSIIISWYNYK